MGNVLINLLKLNTFSFNSVLHDLQSTQFDGIFPWYLQLIFKLTSADIEIKNIRTNNKKLIDKVFKVHPPYNITKQIKQKDFI